MRLVNTVLGAFIVFALVLSNSGNSNATVMSTFDTGKEGWTHSEGVTWEATGGNGGGYLRFTDAGPASGGQLFAPSEFLGDWTALDGVGSISYDFRVFQTGEPYFNHFIEISGSAGTAGWNAPLYTAETDWLNFSVMLDESLWTVVGDWNLILQNVTQFRISTAISTDAIEIVGVDNVNLGMATVPEPSTILFIGIGLAGVFGIRRKLKN